MTVVVVRNIDLGLNTHQNYPEKHFVWGPWLLGSQPLINMGVRLTESISESSLLESESIRGLFLRLAIVFAWKIKINEKTPHLLSNRQRKLAIDKKYPNTTKNCRVEGLSIAHLILLLLSLVRLLDRHDNRTELPERYVTYGDNKSYMNAASQLSQKSTSSSRYCLFWLILYYFKHVFRLKYSVNSNQKKAKTFANIFKQTDRL